MKKLDCKRNVGGSDELDVKMANKKTRMTAVAVDVDFKYSTSEYYLCILYNIKHSCICCWFIRF